MRIMLKKIMITMAVLAVISVNVFAEDVFFDNAGYDDAELFAGMTGDVDLDGDIDIDDAILLFQNSLLPGVYPVEYTGNLDFTMDGNVDIDDAIMLFQHSMLPDLYPIEQPDPVRATEDAYTLANNKSMSGSKEGISSGWVLDNRGGPARVSNNGVGALGDVSEKYPTAFIREFNLIDSGRLVTELSLTAQENGAFIEFRDKNEESTYMLKIVDGNWSLLKPDGSYITLTSATGKSLFRIVTDIDKNDSETYIDGIKCESSELLSDNILSLRIGFDEEGTGTLSVSEVNIVANYSIYDDFELFGLNSVYGWKTEGYVNVSNKEVTMYFSSSLFKGITPIEGTVTTEMYFNTVNGDNFVINIGNALAVENKDGKLVAAGKELYSLTSNMWYRLRVDTNTTAGTAKIWLNGRTVGNVRLEKKAPISHLKVSSSGALKLDNIKLYGTVEHDDYCPKPANMANLNDYIVAVNICSLWRNGTHYGWACITPYDEPTPVLGYYDEGVPEMADWEIKYMVEHGIDVQAFCWYGDVSQGPIKKPYLGEQLHDGYMYAKYSNYMKYVIQWETSATKHFDSEQFREYIVPYWFENYFLDSRYLKIDNKIVLPIYNLQNLITDKYFGSVDAARAEFDYLDSVARENGFDGLIILASGTPSSLMENLGIDGTYAYNWGEEGRLAKVNKDRIANASNSSDTVYAVPTVSVGFDSVPWLHLRNGLMTKSDFASVLQWIRDVHLPKQKNMPSWAENLVWLSTWNEYGEGTYISPARQNGDGFGYIDCVRSELTNLPDEHNDVVPTQNQLERITHMYPQYARLLRREGWYKYDSNLDTVNKEPKNKLYINDIDILANTSEEFHLPPVVKNGKVYFPFNPSTAVNYILGCHYEWRKNEGTIRILANGHEVKYKVGSTKYTLDGVSKNLDYKLETFDGVPLIDFVLLANELGYEVEEKDGNVYIRTDTYEDVWVKYHNRKTGEWEFNDCDSEGWSSSHFDLTVGGGSMVMTTNGTNDNDPVAYYNETAFPKDFYTKRYTDFEMKVRYNYDSSYRQTFVLYYITDMDSSWNEEKSIRFSLSRSGTNGAWRIYAQDLAELSPWQNAERITGLRLDPFNCGGTFEIDYIRFIEDPNFEYVPPEEKEFEIINGDAEDPSVNRFYSGNSNISIVQDPDNEENHVYLVESHEGNQYAYIRYAAEYEQGATYIVEYDLRLVGNYLDDPEISSTNIMCNLRYRDKTASGSIEHSIKGVNISFDDGWVHFTATHTVENIESNSGAEFTIYADPRNGTGFNYMIDNVVIKKVSE